MDYLQMIELKMLVGLVMSALLPLDARSRRPANGIVLGTRCIETRLAVHHM